jgi:hypothetical protein
MGVLTEPSQQARREIAPRAVAQLADRQKLQAEFERLFRPLEHDRSSSRGAAALYVLLQPLDVLSAPEATVWS